ncbi:2Fe-2S iron-sulfur cluster-binding protein [Synechococcus sp. BIOS-U3-1]|uniref:2Fe-2S iron-sulfur cluster-binding protein n=1 Tax=Synechococcus sp. BIOS-U3-1 TaxID=1400865 RepID=UPI001644EAAF|nr:2Fe-2S iron-sulfur cluster-binding protein [Synechococcus sp. BIOS-U3-1]
MTSGHNRVEILWPDGQRSVSYNGEDWLSAARQAGVHVPTGCMGGSCGACEIDVDGSTVRACISTVPASASGQLKVELATDPYW